MAIKWVLKWRDAMNLKTANNLVLMTIVGSILLSMVIEALWFKIFASVMITIAMINYYIVMKKEKQWQHLIFFVIIQ